MMEDLLRRNRKYKAFLLGFLTATLLLAFERISGGEWVTATLAFYATYAGANVIALRGNGK